jgi:hypothetical protein
MCAASLVLGVNLAFQQQQRFAAAESVPAEQASRAISTVMLGTLARRGGRTQLALALQGPGAPATSTRARSCWWRRSVSPQPPCDALSTPRQCT